MLIQTRAVCIAALALLLSACGGSGGDTPGAAADLACSGTACGRENSPEPQTPLVCRGPAAAQCPQGYRCVDDATDMCGDPECSGICVLGEALPSCGGLAGAACADGSICVDDPEDGCEGGPAVDCPGICRPTADAECSTDADCPPLRIACSVCADGTVSCPHSTCDNGQCKVGFKACSEPQVCGGITGQACEPGFECADDPTDECAPDQGGADCRGICQPQVQPPRACGGTAGQVCPADYECVYDAGDMCDPTTGADCRGVCKPASAGQCESNEGCPKIRAPCSVCADGMEVCPSSSCDNGVCNVAYPTCPTPPGCLTDAECKPEEVCVGGANEMCDPSTGSSCGGVCVPRQEPRSCGGIAGDTCPPGYECVDDSSDTCDPATGADCGGFCKPVDAGQCQSDDQCPRILAPCHVCADGTFACPSSRCSNGMCSVVMDACTSPDFCGGIAGFPCPPGSTCVDTPNDDCDPEQGGADCGGMCVREEKPKRCSTSEPCPQGFECVDENDACDSATDASCAAICKPAPMSICTDDSDCLVIGAPCRLCADGTAACPSVHCGAGQCVAKFETCTEER